MTKKLLKTSITLQKEETAFFDFIKRKLGSVSDASVLYFIVQQYKEILGVHLRLIDSQDIKEALEERLPPDIRNQIDSALEKYSDLKTFSALVSYCVQRTLAELDSESNPELNVFKAIAEIRQSQIEYERHMIDILEDMSNKIDRIDKRSNSDTKK